MISAVNKGVGNSDNTPENTKQLAEKLKQNIYAFSAAKSFVQMQYYRDMMIGDDGNILGKGSYIKKIANTGEIFNKKYLDSEYENAYYSTIMADKWDRFGDDEYLQYSTVGDSNVRPSHAALDKYTAPKSAAFWVANYPPNGWNCRCTVVPGKENYHNRLDEKEAGNHLKAENKDTPFYNNVGLSKVIFKDNHPYFVDSKGKESNLSWEQYGMQNINQIRSSQLAEYIAATKEEYLKWWNETGKIKNSESIAMSDMFGSRIVLKKNAELFQHAKNAESILNKPDEVWMNPNDKTKKVYLKYYENETVKITVNNINHVESISVITKGENSEIKKLDEARKGILLHR